MQKIQMQYDIIFGQSYILVPMEYTEIKPTKVIGEVRSLKKAQNIRAIGRKR